MRGRGRKPSPALVVATIALIAAMSGAAIALPGKNSVKSNDIAKNSVKSKQIKKNAIKSKHVKDGAIGGAEIADGAVTGAKLGADSVDGSKVADGSLSGADLGSESVGPEKIQSFAVSDDGNLIRVVATEAATLAAAQTAAPETALYSNGPVDVYAKCFRDSAAGEIRGEIYARTTADGAMMEGNDDLPDFNATLLDAATVEENRELDTQNATVANTASFDEAEGLIATPTGEVDTLLTAIGVKQGALPGGNGPFGAGNVCLFSLTAVG